MTANKGLYSPAAHHESAVASGNASANKGFNWLHIGSLKRLQVTK